MHKIAIANRNSPEHTHGVVAALLHRQVGVGLHADEGQIRGGAHQGTQTTGSQAAHGLLPQRQRLQQASMGERRVKALFVSKRAVNKDMQ